MEPPEELMTMDTAIQIQAMSCRFGAIEAVRNLTLEVPTGSIYAFLGTNGAGKTTTIKALLNLIRPSAGSARVLGVDSARLSPRELARIAYVSENQSLPERLTVQQLVSYCAALYPTWDEALCRHLTGKFALPPNQPLQTFSRGMKIKAALLVSLAYRPELLLMDEPFGGLDPLMRDDLIQGLLELSWSRELDRLYFLPRHRRGREAGRLRRGDRQRRLGAVGASGEPTLSLSSR